MEINNINLEACQVA